MCHVEVWGVLFICVKVGVVCTNGKLLSLLDLIESQDWKCQRKIGVLGFSYMCDVSWGRKFLMRG
jgi:hypothetical protein